LPREFTFNFRAMLTYHETPVQEIHDQQLSRAGLKLLIKREDLNHPFVSGNKWWKLKYNLEEAIRHHKQTLLTYGGAYSNHIYATAAAASELKLKSIGIIRGEETNPLNPTLTFAKNMGMELRYISRIAYRSKQAHAQYVNELEECYAIPEGGSNLLAVKGVSEFGKKLGGNFDYLCCPVGTGGTLAGLIDAVDNTKTILGFSALKGGQLLTEEIKKLLPNQEQNCRWELIHDYHFGGYAKATVELLRFIDAFKTLHRVPLEFVYTGKMLAGIFDLISKGFFKRGATILVIHTGGLQGSRS
jgi:1-aminocyclopropane-1-carboxylate deaminase